MVNTTYFLYDYDCNKINNHKLYTELENKQQIIQNTVNQTINNNQKLNINDMPDEKDEAATLLLDNESKINGNVPVNLFILRKLDSFTLGYLIASWEHRTFITAMMLGINPFDQFGVNAGKIYTKQYLADNN